MVMALLVLVILFALGSSFMTLMVGENQIAVSHRDLTLALNAAEAGVQQALRNAKAAPDLTTLLRDSTPGTGNNGSGTLQGGVSYTYTIANDPFESGTPTTDINSTVLITSTGRARNATRTIETLVFVPKANFPAALHVPGTEGDSLFVGASFTVDGRDTDPASETSTGAVTKLGVGAGSIAVRDEIYNAMNAAERTAPVFNGVAGDYGGQPSLGVDTSLDSTTVQNLATAWGAFASPQNTITIGRGTLSVSGTHSYANGAGGGPTLNNSQAWGTPQQPGVFYIKGISEADYHADPSGVSGAMTVSGDFQGAGVLILDGSDLVISGNFRWEGIILVTGPLVGFKLLGGGTQKIFGSVVVNEREADQCAVRADCLEVLINESARIMYSQSSIKNALRALGQRFTYWNERGA
jgi:type II secretory pathway pseudopilin PulG